jgi:hypothetical protein
MATMKYPKSIKSKSYPKFIRQDKSLATIKINKAFHKFGLKNCKKTIIHNGKSYNVVFSSHPWDIATMSMRGISSCQKWTGDFKKRLIGSIADPCAAIIYIESKQYTKYGKKMCHRAVVRLVQSKEKKAIFLEKTYPQKYRIVGYYTAWHGASLPRYDYAPHKFPQEVFIKMLKTLTNIPIITNKSNYKIPLSKTVKSIPISKRSYRDSKIGYTKQILI